MGEGRAVRAVIAAVLALSLVACGGKTPGKGSEDSEPAGEPVVEPVVVEEEILSPKPFGEYSWDELRQIANLIEQAPSEEDGRAVALEYGLISEDGTISSQTRQLDLPNGVICDVRIVGILHDERSDGQGLAGITFMAGPIDVQAMNPSPVAAGGWEACEMRSWLASDGMSLLPEDLSSAIVSVRKATNNVGITNTYESVTFTDDALWLFSPHEVCGDLSWFSDEFGSRFTYMDSVINAEGAQYEAFAEGGVTGESDPGDMLVLPLMGQKCPWWYRSPYPLNANDASDPGVFYQVMASGYPSSVGQADVAVGVVVGFCL